MTGPPLPDRTEMLERMYARDRSADGRFVTGVLTTGIYCLPSCRARKPKAANVVFFRTEAEAAASGLRPCKRCRPDAFYLGIDPDLERLRGAIETIASDPTAVPDVAAFADRVGVGLSKLHELTRRHAGASPSTLIHAGRIRAAQNLLRSGSTTATGAAYAVGYESVSAFYERFKQVTGTTPGAYAKTAKGERHGD